MPCAQKRLQSSTEGVVYPLQPDQREFFCIVKKVNDARNHESAAAHLLRDAEYVAQWQHAASRRRRQETQRAAAQEAAHRASRAVAVPAPFSEPFQGIITSGVSCVCFWG